MTENEYYEQAQKAIPDTWSEEKKKTYILLGMAGEVGEIVAPKELPYGDEGQEESEFSDFLYYLVLYRKMILEKETDITEIEPYLSSITQADEKNNIFWLLDVVLFLIDTEKKKLRGDEINICDIEEQVTQTFVTALYTSRYQIENLFEMSLKKLQYHHPEAGIEI